MPPQLIFGTGNFGMQGTGSFQDADGIKELIPVLRDLNITRIDTAARYPPPSPGLAEKLVGETAHGFVVDTKVYTNTSTDGSGDLSQEKLEKSVHESMVRLDRESVNIIYSHRADPSTPLVEQVKNFNNLIEQRRCKYWGVSNTPPAVLEEMLKICDEHGWQRPRYYQGSYNLITRGMESNLLHVLRSNDVSFIGYQPLAASFLTASVIRNETIGTRFDSTSPVGGIMQKMFSGDQLVAGMKQFDDAVREKGLTSIEVALRWLMHHSSLTDGDGVILGASRIEQLRETVALCKKGPLQDDVLALTDHLWESVKDLRGGIL